MTTNREDDHMIQKRCTRGERHWFTRYGWVGSSAPTCRHCGADNPNYDPERDPLADDKGARA